jgi:hypothetical protein
VVEEMYYQRGDELLDLRHSTGCPANLPAPPVGQPLPMTTKKTRIS